MRTTSPTPQMTKASTMIRKKPRTTQVPGSGGRRRSCGGPVWRCGAAYTSGPRALPAPGALSYQRQHSAREEHAMRQLIAGNWKMNVLRAPRDGAGAAVRAGAAGPRLRTAGLPALHRDRAGRPGAGRLGGRGGRPGLPPRKAGRAYRRHLRRHAARCRRDLGDPRPFRAPRRTTARPTNWCARRCWPRWRPA